MKIHKTTYTHPTLGKIVTWSGSDSEAAKVRKDARHNHCKPVTEAVEVDTKKQGLIAFLNGSAPR